MKVKSSLIYIILSAVCLLFGCVASSQAPPVSGVFSFCVLQTGKSDAIFMQTQNYNIILDCGDKDDGDKIVELLNQKGVSKIDYLFLTHFDSDHVGGFPYVMENVEIDKIIVPDYPCTNKAYAKATIKNRNITALNEDTTLMLDDVIFEVSVPKKKSYAEEDNDFSLVISITHGNNNFLFTGDAEEERTSEILAQFDKHYDILKAPHHGIYNSTTQELINTTKPKHTIITDSTKKPTDARTMLILKEIKSKIHTTKSGNILVSSDGYDISIQYKTSLRNLSERSFFAIFCKVFCFQRCKTKTLRLICDNHKSSRHLQKKLP